MKNTRIRWRMSLEEHNWHQALMAFIAIVWRFSGIAGYIPSGVA